MRRCALIVFAHSTHIAYCSIDAAAESYRAIAAGTAVPLFGLLGDRTLLGGISDQPYVAQEMPAAAYFVWR